MLTRPITVLFAALSISKPMRINHEILFPQGKTPVPRSTLCAYPCWQSYRRLDNKQNKITEIPKFQRDVAEIGSI